MLLSEISYYEIHRKDIYPALFKNYDRYQDVKKCWRKEYGDWVLKDIAFTEQWGNKEFIKLCSSLSETLGKGGSVFGAYQNGILIGFASIENELFGINKEYLQLSNVHISFKHRNLGIGKKLFYLVCEKAKELGAKKLYISAHSSQETIAFYRAMGCIEAKEYNSRLVEEEPCDCQMEYDLF